MILVFISCSYAITCIYIVYYILYSTFTMLFVLILLYCGFNMFIILFYVHLSNTSIYLPHCGAPTHMSSIYLHFVDYS